MSKHKLWCIEDIDGLWCAAKDQKHEPDVTDNVATLCGIIIACPVGLEIRQPTCKICRKRQKMDQ